MNKIESEILMKTFSVYAPGRFQKFKTEIGFLCEQLSLAGWEYFTGKADLIVVIGGDGSLLNALKVYGYTGNYILINAGTLGHYADYGIAEIDSFIKDLRSKKPLAETHRVLELQTPDGHWLAANDIMIGSAVKTLKLRIKTDALDFIETAASGVLFSTPLGSSGYAHSLGGTLLLGDEGIELNLLAPLQNRVHHTQLSSIVLPDQAKIDLEITNEMSFEVATDMNVCQTASRTFNIKKSDVSFSLIHFGGFAEITRLKKSFADR